MTPSAYKPRPVAFLKLWEEGPWRMKVYGIAYGRLRPEEGLVEHALRVASGVLAAVRDHYGVGFIGVHQGKTGNFVFIDWWAQENELHHRVFVSAPETPLDFVETTALGPTACVWDLAVIHYEREAWVETVMKPGSYTGFDAYLARRLTGEV